MELKTLRHPVAALVIFAISVVLLVNMYNGIVDGYNVSSTDVKTLLNNEGDLVTDNIINQLNNLDLVDGIAQIENSIQEMRGPSSLITDLGAIALIATGIIKVIIGLITTPFAVLSIIGNFYGPVVGIISDLLSILIVYVSFILLSAYLRSDV